MSCDDNCMQRQIELDGTESNVEILSELRAQFNCFDEVEEPVYRALSDAISALKGWWSYPLPAQPNADFATVVRCKDCKHNQCKSTSGNALCELFYGMTDQMGFCHCGERRNGWED